MHFGHQLVLYTCFIYRSTGGSLFSICYVQMLWNNCVLTVTKWSVLTLLELLPRPFIVGNCGGNLSFGKGEGRAFSGDISYSPFVIILFEQIPGVFWMIWQMVQKYCAQNFSMLVILQMQVLRLMIPIILLGLRVSRLHDPFGHLCGLITQDNIWFDELRK